MAGTPPTPDARQEPRERLSDEVRSSGLGLTGRRVLITGGSKNIGRAIAEGLADDGAHVFIIARSDDAALQETLGDLRSRGVEADGLLQDLSDAEGVERVMRSVATDFGPIDVLISNAAARPRAELADITIEEWDEVMAINLRAPFLLARAVLPGMMERGFGRIVNISGMDAYWGRTMRAHVSTSKLGIVGLSRVLALESAPHGVTVNTVVPGTIDTRRDHLEWYPELEARYDRRRDRIPMGRLGTPIEVAAAVLFLCSTGASYITGQEYFLSGGGYPLVRE